MAKFHVNLFLFSSDVQMNKLDIMNVGSFFTMMIILFLKFVEYLLCAKTVLNAFTSIISCKWHNYLVSQVLFFICFLQIRKLYILGFHVGILCHTGLLSYNLIFEGKSPFKNSL